MDPSRDANAILDATSRTFAIPIARLPGALRDAVASAYLCLRAIDEIEDHASLTPADKVSMLRGISTWMQSGGDRLDGDLLDRAVGDRADSLPEVTLRVEEWAMLAPPEIAPRIWDATAAMADRMATWVERDFRVSSEADLDCYTFGVAGAVGLLLSDLWQWHDGIATDRRQSVAFGRGLQSVNILRNRREDVRRGVGFYPSGWDDERMQRYSRGNLAMASEYTAALPAGPIREFCQIPLDLALATLDALQEGREKLSRADVRDVVARAVGGGRTARAPGAPVESTTVATSLDDSDRGQG